MVELRRLGLLAVHLFASVAMAAHASAVEYDHAIYVAPDGSDANRGTLELPLRTLEEARLRVQSYKSTSGIGPGGHCRLPA